MREAEMQVAVVHAPDGVRFVAVAPAGRALMAIVADYVARRAPLALWPRDARAVRRCLAAGDAEGAIRRYFAATGARWDEESLSILALEGNAATAGC